MSSKTIAIGVGIMAATWGSATHAELKRYTLDLGHAHIGWEIDHFGFSNTIGHFRSFDGVFMLDEASLENSQIEFIIDAKSIDSNHVGRDNHLKASDLLNTDKYPSIEFVSNEIKMLGANHGHIKGDLTFMGTTHTLMLEFEVTDDARFASFLPRYDELRAIGIEASGKFNRIDHGLEALNFPGSPLGEIIELDIHFDLVDCDGAPENNIPCQYGRNSSLEFPNE